MRSVGRKLVAACGVLAMACTMAACGGDTASDADDNSLMTVEVFDQLANYQGEQKGWFARPSKTSTVIRELSSFSAAVVLPDPPQAESDIIAASVTAAAMVTFFLRDIASFLSLFPFILQGWELRLRGRSDRQISPAHNGYREYRTVTNQPLTAPSIMPLTKKRWKNG